MNTQTSEFEVDDTTLSHADGPALELVFEAHPDESIAQLIDQPQKPRLINGVPTKESKRVTPIDPEVILTNIQSHTDGWPKCVAGELVVKSSSGKLEIKKNDAQYFAWLYEYLDIDWYGSPGIPKKEFFEFCRCNSERYVDAADYPHFPPIEGILYQHEQATHENGQALNGFLEFFTPATPQDRELIISLLLTFFWGGTPGARPMYLITTEDDSANQGRGWGKTTLLTMCAELCGGMLSTSQSGSIEALKKRILNQANHEPRPRVIAIDNVKTRRFSSADLEALVTSRTVSDHVLYSGNGSIPNLQTVGITINGASLSKDMAQRCVIIKVGKPEYTQNWQQDLEDYIENKRWAIIGDIGQLLLSEQTLPDAGTGRRGKWERDVLSKLNHPLQLRQLMKSREKQVDDDAANGHEFVKHLEENLQSMKIYPSGIVRIPQVKMHELLADFLGERVGKNSVKKKVEALGLPCLHQVVKPGKLRVWLFRKDGQALTSEQIESATNLPAQ
ncbi:MAG: hypothetical protein K0U86_18910 [Planctomycetes bacterium]|nr:hypothetical protein [Planctomycetota bacterium]MCH9726980.1 hypothetical protein [Planctomycetota bacterium]MCH9775230.1 hypothetical protein [Planctomycetota bacterium]MCH9790017.1 hypothetical protein [Planctomycetota bacterium]